MDIRESATQLLTAWMEKADTDRLLQLIGTLIEQGETL